MHSLLFGRVKSPVGAFLIACEGATLCAAEFAAHEDRMLAALRARYGAFRRREVRDPGGVCTRIRAYLRGAFDAVDDIAVDGGGTAFQRQVWAALRRIAPGEVVSYGALARRLGRPSAVRAVAHANARNPINIVVPCHRVIGADGTLTGFAAGLDRKRFLLDLEQGTPDLLF